MSNNNHYSIERNTQILIYLLKANGIDNVVASPGATNIGFVQSVQSDPFFKVYSSVDERSAAYMAVGLAREIDRPVVISCTGATASRNYLSAMTEGYYSNIPIIAVTSSQPTGRLGHNIPQVIDRSNIQNDIAKMSVELPVVKDAEDEWTCQTKANQAILASFGFNRGPVHINLVTMYNMDFSVKNILGVDVIKQHVSMNDINQVIEGRIAILCGTHSPWNEELVAYVDAFCRNHNAVVISDATGNYKGEFGVTDSLIFTQEVINRNNDFDLIIHMGGVSATYYNYNISVKSVWRISPDGRIIDTFRKLTDVFKVSEMDFFKYFYEIDKASENKGEKHNNQHQIHDWNKEKKRLRKKIPELPFSNIWIAMNTIDRIPGNSAVYLGILNSLRAWSMFQLPQNVYAYANTGGFGIDGYISSILGASLANPSKLYYGVIGDLAFFYDMNALGNRHFGNNIRLLVINNGCGTEFLNYNHMAAVLNDDEKKVVAATGHYGNKSELLIKNYAENLGLKYLSARNKKEYLSNLDEFLVDRVSECSIVFEIFTNWSEESKALQIMNTLDGSYSPEVKESLRVPDRFKEIYENRSLILWGTGNCFRNNIDDIKEKFIVDHLCDNDVKKWGKDYCGITCISPDELKKIKNVFVVIMVQDISKAFQIANQLIEMGIKYFDVFDNWNKYSEMLLA